jgi:hypothetical protein
MNLCCNQATGKRESDAVQCQSFDGMRYAVGLSFGDAFKALSEPSMRIDVVHFGRCPEGWHLPP